LGGRGKKGFSKPGAEEVGDPCAGGIGLTKLKTVENLLSGDEHENRPTFGTTIRAKDRVTPLVRREGVG